MDPTTGDFRENLIPVTIAACDGSAGQKFDIITAGAHNNVKGTALIVSTQVFTIFLHRGLSRLMKFADSRMPQL